MMETTKLEDDLGYVRRAMDRGEAPPSPPVTYFLWAGIILAGYVLADLRPPAVALYWTIAAPAGFVASALLGWRHLRNAGHLDWALGRRHMLHWSGLMVALGLSVLPVAVGSFGWEAFARNTVLLTALGYWLAGVHLEPALRWVAVVMGAGYVALLLGSGPVWTLAGALIAAALAVSGVLAGRKRVPRRG